MVINRRERKTPLCRGREIPIKSGISNMDFWVQKWAFVGYFEEYQQDI